MKKTDLLFKRIDEYLDERENNDYHNMLSTMVDSAFRNRIYFIMRHEKIINKYFDASPDVYDTVKEWKVPRLIKLLEKIIKFNRRGGLVK